MTDKESFFYYHLAKFFSKRQQTEQHAFANHIFGLHGQQVLHEIKELHPDLFAINKSNA
jgi:primosomal protein N''